METKANYTIVGFFTVAVMAAAFVFVFWMSQYGRSGPTVELMVRIPGSANGLSIGSPVRFNGIQVGAVKSLAIDAEDPNYSVAITGVSANAPIYESTEAVLEVQGLTGAAYIELSGGNPEENNILQVAADNDQIAVISAEQSSVTNLLSTADKILSRADSALKDIQEFTAEARVPLTNTVKNVETFSAALRDNADGVDEFLKSVSAMSETVTSLSGRLDRVVGSAERILDAVDEKKVDSILTSADKVASDIAGASGQVDELIASYKKAADRIENLGANAEKTLARVDKILAAADPEKVGKAVDDASAALADAREAVAAFKSVAESINGRKESIDATITNVAEMAEKLNAASTRVDGVLAKVDGLLGSDDAGSLMADARDTLKSIKKVADTLAEKVGPIANGLADFSGGGLRDVEALVSETRRTMRSLENTIENFDQNPQRVIFGGDTVKTFDGRNRR